MYGIGSHTHTQTKSRARRSCDCYEIQIVISLHLHRRISLRYLHQRQISYFDWANNSSDFTANLRQLPNCMRRCKMFSPSCSIFLPIVVENLPERFVVSGFANKKNFFSIFLEFVLVTVNASVRVSQFDLYGFFSLERERNGNEQKKNVYDDDCLHLQLASTDMATSFSCFKSFMSKIFSPSIFHIIRRCRVHICNV